MKDVENLFQRLGTKSDYKDFGSKMLDDVRGKWPLLNDVSESEKTRQQLAVVTHAAVESSLPYARLADTLSADSAQPVSANVQAMEFKAEVQEQKLPVRAFVSKKPQAASSVRDIFKSIGKSGRLGSDTGAESAAAAAPAPVPKGRSLFANTKPKDGNKV